MDSTIQMYSLNDLTKIRDELANEFVAAARGLKTSFMFAKHSIAEPDPSSHEAQVFVIGGTNMSYSVVEQKSGVIEILQHTSEPLPIIANRTILLSLINKYVTRDYHLVCINFAYPLTPVIRESRLDGILLKGTKDHAFSGLVGEEIGSVVENHLNAKYTIPMKVAVANDTVCLVLAGKGHWDPNTLVGGVVGTGFNFGFFTDSHTVVNIESGNFATFTQSDTGRIIDSNSNNPGSQRYEKEISGAYLYKHYNLYAEKNDFSIKNLSSTEKLAMISQGDAKESMYARYLFERSASLVAALIAAIYNYKNQEPLNILIEGSLYWKGWQYPTFVQNYLTKLGVPEQRLKIHCLTMSSVLGASRLLL